jgi:hypothetical protein
MGTYENPGVIQPLGAQALISISDKMTLAAREASKTLNKAYQDNLAKNEKLREKDLAATRTWGQQLNKVQETEYTNFELNTRNFLTTQGDRKFDLQRRARLKSDDDNYLDMEEFNKQDLLFEKIPAQVNQCNQAIAENMQKYLGIKGKDNQKDGVDIGRTDNKWLVIMQDFDKNDGKNISYDFKKGKLYLVYTDDQGVTTDYDAQKFVRGSLKGKNLIKTCGDISGAVSGLVNNAMGKDKDGKGGWYRGIPVTREVTREVNGEEKVFKQLVNTYANERLYYGEGGNKDAIIGGIYKQDWSSIYGNKDLMETLYTQLQNDALKGDWKTIKFDGKVAQSMTDDSIFGEDYKREEWTGSPEQIKIAMSLIPAYIKANAQEFGIGEEYLLQEVDEGQPFLKGYNKPE